jgi:solute:Na+ symporter, SSS family
VDAVVGTAVLLCTLAVFVALGLAAGRDRDVDTYTTARGSQGARTLGLSFLGAGVGAWVLFAPPEVGAGVGVVAVVGYAVGAAVPVLLFGLLGGRIRRALPRGRSVAELARARFGRVFAGWVALASLAYMGLFVTAELTAVAGVTGLLAGVDPTLSVLAVATATLAYTTWGGLRASLVTDRWQAGLIVALLAVGVAAVLVDVPDAAGAVARSGLLGVDRVGGEVALTLVIAVTAANALHQGYWQRVWAAQDERALRRGAWLGAALTVPVVLVVGLLGVLAAGTGRGLDASPVPFFSLTAGLPAVVLAVVLVLGVALVASSVDTLETGLVSLVVAEVPGASLAAARVAAVLVVVPAVVVAVQGHSVLRLFLVADLLCAGVVAPLLSALWHRATAAGALSGAVAGLLGAVVPAAVAGGSLAEGLRQASFPGAVPTLGPFAGAVLCSAAATVGVSLLGRRSAPVVDLDAARRPEDEGAAPAPA